jgi:hypothetical protein
MHTSHQHSPIIVIPVLPLLQDGRPATDAALEPGYTSFAKRVLYSTYDVTEQLKAGGSHVLGVELGNGYWDQAGGKPTGTCTMFWFWGGEGGPAMAVVHCVSSGWPHVRVRSCGR